MNKLAILGKLPTKFKAPFGDPEFDIWAFNYHTEELPRVDVWFDIHANNPNPKAVITRANFPFLEVNNMLGGNYFNNSASYLIAYAILKGYKEIYLYGMQFQTDEEKRKREYANVRELIFFAKGKGIKVFAPYDEVMLKTYPIYGA
jgi:hypothetical protein